MSISYSSSGFYSSHKCMWSIIYTHPCRTLVLRWIYHMKETSIENYWVLSFSKGCYFSFFIWKNLRMLTVSNFSWEKSRSFVFHRVHRQAKFAQSTILCFQYLGLHDHTFKRAKLANYIIVPGSTDSSNKCLAVRTASIFVSRIPRKAAK